MKLPKYVHLNYAPIVAVLFTVMCWLGLYAVYADFGQLGLELLQRPGLVSTVEGMFFVGLHAMGLLLLVAFALAAVTMLMGSGSRPETHDEPSRMEHPF
jgi:disulfide bond formation protein DsbB